MKKILEALYSLLFFFIFAFYTAFFGIISHVSILFSPRGKVAHWCMRMWSRCTLATCRVTVRVEGLENIARDRVQIFASNHASHFDIFILSTVIPVRFGWVAKAILFKIPFIGWHMWLNGYISINRTNRTKAIKSMDLAAEKVKRGNRITIFPEGTRSRTGVLQPFKKGLFHLCVQTGVPIVPIFIRNSYHILPPGSMILHPSTVYVKIGEKMPTAGYSVEKIEIIMSDLRKRIETLEKEAAEMEKRFGG
ncbi:MAG: 1-acyl-sn-glycerol-3-phosphate acyltransferase [Spirochaetes bacterium]|nr:MAG: 1-acyl-sn-glycerol-3-phosphate acyltransferase [Spirochaetota bacterium]